MKKFKFRDFVVTYKVGEVFKSLVFSSYESVLLFLDNDSIETYFVEVWEHD